MTDNGKIVQFPDLAAVESEAANWVARLDSGEMSAEDYAEFLEWQNRSDLHRDAVGRIEGVWAAYESLRKATTAQRVDVDAMPPFEPAPQLRIPWKAASIAAVCMAAVVLAGFGLVNRSAQAPIVLQFETGVGRQKSVVLADGSVMTLNTDSKVGVVYSSGSRTIHLTRGEAFFEVKHDPERPFMVQTPNGQVWDIGTAFDVRVLPKLVAVTVESGKVEVSHEQQLPLGSIVAGQSAIFGRQIERLETIPNPALKRQLAWRDGRLSYEGEPLSHVLSDIGRYTNTRIELVNPELGYIPVTGNFPIDRIDVVFSALEVNFNIRSRWVDARHVVLYSSARNQRQDQTQSLGSGLN